MYECVWMSRLLDRLQVLFLLQKKWSIPLFMQWFIEFFDAYDIQLVQCYVVFPKENSFSRLAFIYNHIFFLYNSFSFPFEPFLSCCLRPLTPSFVHCLSFQLSSNVLCVSLSNPPTLLWHILYENISSYHLTLCLWVIPSHTPLSKNTPPPTHHV